MRLALQSKPGNGWNNDPRQFTRVHGPVRATTMANEEHLARLKQSQASWNAWREQHPQLTPDFSGADLRLADLRLYNLDQSNFAGAILCGADLSGSFFRQANLAGANLSQAILDLADFSDADLRQADLRGSSGGRLFGRANLRKANLEGVNLSSAKFDGADLREASAASATLTGADLSDANLSHADLRSAYLSQSVLAGANLTGTDLSAAFAVDASFERARLLRANLAGATLRGASLAWADLVQTDLRKADLSDANLCYTRLVECDLTQARLVGCCADGVSPAHLLLDGANQTHLVLRLGGAQPVTVDDLDIAHLLSLIVGNDKAAQLVGGGSSRIALVLGCFPRSRQIVLEAIRDELKRAGYVPVTAVFDDANARHEIKNLAALAQLARFIIAEITEPRGIIQALVSIVESTPPVPILPLHEYGTSPWRLSGQMKQYTWVFGPRPYSDWKDLADKLRLELIGTLETKASELGQNTSF
ncbi:MAG: pentapeptide repeat-containing protein [Chloroflexi bacterium]|nr:pentapeptide repeat-containing protein [Chloroflexota bacterium]